jgi:hypothetical protein
MTFKSLGYRHDTENSKQIFPEKELCGLRSNFLIHVSVSDLYIPTIGLPIMPKAYCLMWKLGLRPRNSFCGNT